MIGAMHTNTITTNVRFPVNDWRQAKVAAADVGISVNELIKRAVKRLIQQQHSPDYPTPIMPRSLTLGDLPKIAYQGKAKKSGLSDDDKVIYGE